MSKRGSSLLTKFNPPKAWYPAIKRSQAIHREFYQLPTPDKDFFFNLNWPDPQGIVGSALAIGYWSDKFDWIQREYIHRHNQPYPTIVRQSCEKDGDQWFQPQWHPPDPPVWAFLGFCLDLQFDRGRGEEYFDWKQEKSLPLLGWDKEQRMLVIQSTSTNDPPILLSSPILTVTGRGIEN